MLKIPIIKSSTVSIVLIAIIVSSLVSVGVTTLYLNLGFQGSKCEKGDQGIMGPPGPTGIAGELDPKGLKVM
jgi:hypothetical protein